jgi:hypothetical protein
MQRFESSHPSHAVRSPPRLEFGTDQSRSMFEVGYSLIPASGSLNGPTADPPAHFFKPRQARMRSFSRCQSPARSAMGRGAGATPLSGAEGLYRWRGSPGCPASERCCAGATAVSDRGPARRRLAGAGGRRYCSKMVGTASASAGTTTTFLSTAARRGRPAQRGRATRRLRPRR